MTLEYTVTVSLSDEALLAEWLAWLWPHIDEVIAAGATAARVVRLDGPTPTVAVHYTFASRAAFAAYERDHAPRLRADGLARFPTSRGITYARSVGEVLDPH